jgi:hypothetical protein
LGDFLGDFCGRLLGDFRTTFERLLGDFWAIFWPIFHTLIWSPGTQPEYFVTFGDPLIKHNFFEGAFHGTH